MNDINSFSTPEGLSFQLKHELVEVGIWPVHPVWQVVQVAFMHPAPSNPGPVVRFRVREKNLERGVAATIGYLSTLAAWLGNEYVSEEADLSLVLQ